MEIPKQLKNEKFCKIRFGDKRPLEGGWQNIHYSYSEISKTFPKMNYGVLAGINGLGILDDDTADNELMKLYDLNFPKTFQSRGHYYIRLIGWDNKKIVLKDPIKKNEKGEALHLGELQGKGSQAVGPGSTHPNGSTYNVIQDLSIQEIPWDKFKEVFQKYFKTKIIQEKIPVVKDSSWKGEDIKDIPLTNIFSFSGKSTAKGYQGENPWHGCVVNPLTKVFTPEGCKNIKDIQKGDEVFGKDNSIVKVKNTFRNKYSGKTYILKAGFPEVELTGNHKVLVCKADFKEKQKIKKGKEAILEWRKVSELDINYNIIIPRITPKKKIIKLGNYKLTKSLAYILGKYLADGNLDNRQRYINYVSKKGIKTRIKDGFNHKIQITIHEGKKEQAEKILKCAKTLKIYGSIYHEKKKHTLRITLFSKELLNFIKKYLGIYSLNKSIGKFCISNKEFQFEMIKSYYENDGHFKNNHQRVNSISEKLLKEIQDILVRNKICSRYTFQKTAGKGKSKHDTHWLSWFTKSKQTSYFEDEKYYYVRIKKIITKEVKNIITYDLETEDHTYRVPYIIHNSSTGMNFSIDTLNNGFYCFRCSSFGTAWEAIAIELGIMSCDDAGRYSLTEEERKQVVREAIDKYGLTPPKEYFANTKNLRPKGLAKTINIKEWAIRKGYDKCYKCSKQLHFQEKLGWYACECGERGGILKLKIEPSLEL